MSPSFVLDRASCVALLRAGVVGRIGVAALEGPLVLPVNYSVVADAVVVRTASDGPLSVVRPGDVVAFEVDQVDHARQRGWSVHLRARAEVVAPGPQRDEIDATWPPRPWANGERTRLLRLPWHELTGRRLGPGWDPLRSLAVRRTV